MAEKKGKKTTIKDKKALKATIQTLKGDRKTALEAHDHGKLKSVRRRIRSLKRRMRTAAAAEKKTAKASAKAAPPA